MSQLLELFRSWQDWHGAGRFLAVLSASLGALALAAWVLLRSLQRAAARTETRLDDDLVGALRWPARLWVVLAALLLAVRDLDERTVPRSVEDLLAGAMTLLVLLSLLLAASRVTVILLDHRMRRSGAGQQVTTLTVTMIRLLWAIPVVLVVLRQFNVTLAPALTALGVGGLAVSLALKDTLANVFSGFYISLAGNIHKGDYIRLDSGQEGTVADVRWRITTLRTRDNNLVVIPNSKLSEALVTNFTYPERRMLLRIPVAVAYDSDVAAVERAALAAVAAGPPIEGLLDSPAPAVRFNPGFGDSALNFSLEVHVSDYLQQFAVQDQLRRRLLEAFREAGIQIPYPVRTLDLAPGSLKRALDG